MAVYLLAYDIIKERRSANPYKELFEALQRAGAHRTQYSLWLLRSDRSAKALVEEYKRYLDEDDRVWVTKVPKGAYWYSNAIGGTNDWIAKNPPE